MFFWLLQLGFRGLPRENLLRVTAVRSMTTLRRRTNSPKTADLRKLPENEFWIQAQPILSRYLLEADYKKTLYVPVFVGPGKTLAQEISEFISIPSAPWILELIGQYGVGKSSALRDFAANHLQLQAAQGHDGGRSGIGKGYVWIYFDGNEHKLALNHDPHNFIKALYNEIAVMVAHYLEVKDLDKAAFLQNAISFDKTFASLRLLAKTVDDVIPAAREMLADPVTYVLVALRYLAREVGPGRVVLVLDNLDPLEDQIQIEAVKQAAQLCIGCHAKGLIAVRRSTDTHLRHHDPQVMETLVQTRVPTPSVTEVIRLRIKQALEAEQEALAAMTLGEGTLRMKFQEYPEFTEVLVRGLSSTRVANLLQGLSNESIRDSLQCALRVYNSHFLSAHEIIKKMSPLGQSDWRGFIPYAIVVKSLMFVNSQLYDPQISIVGNIFGSENSNHTVGPFLRLLILKYIQSHPDGEIFAEPGKEELCQVLGSHVDVVNGDLRWCHRQAWTEHGAGDVVRITKRGRFMLNTLLYDIEYLTHIATDVDMYEHLEEKLIAPANTPQHRLSNLSLLLGYLVRRELTMLATLAAHGLGSYVQLFGSLPISIAILDAIGKNVQSARAFEDYEENVANAIRSFQDDLNILRESEETARIADIIRKFA
jgi:hypothetical protein